MIGKLEWLPNGDGYRASGSGDWDGWYEVFRVNKPGEHWGCEYVPCAGAFNGCERLVQVRDLDFCRERAQKHHNGRVRELAWRDYMLNNDPPSPDV